MRILICDDEPPAVERLARLVNQLGHQVVATADNGEDAVDLVKQHKPDLVLLDIQMPEMDGLTCAEQLNQLDPMPAIIFCTAFDEHAIDAFKYRAEGYLLKPISLQDLQQVLERITRLNQAQLNNIKQKVEEQYYKKEKRHQIIAKTHKGVELIPIENIYYFLADQKYVIVRHLKGSVLIDETLKELEQEFSAHFIRIHRNALVGIEHIEGLELVAPGQYQVRCRELSERLAVSRRHLPNLRECIHKL